MNQKNRKYLLPTAIIDSDHNIITDYAKKTIVSAWEKEYGPARVQQWIDAFERSGGKPIRNFNQEKILKDAQRRQKTDPLRVD